MAGQGDLPRIGLLVGSGPYRSRESRAELDLAMAALTLDYRVEIYFSGDAILQLAEAKDGTEANLPAGYKAWAALPGLGDADLYAETEWLNRCKRRGIGLCLPVEGLGKSGGIGLCLPVEGLGKSGMKQRWRQCDKVLVL
jgi:sulfur relay (sulfurtransferase) DsrF/TusC family protein